MRSFTIAGSRTPALLLSEILKQSKIDQQSQENLSFSKTKCKPMLNYCKITCFSYNSILLAYKSVNFYDFEVFKNRETCCVCSPKKRRDYLRTDYEF